MKTRGQLPHLFYPQPTMQRRQINSYAFPMGFDPLSLSPVVWLSDTGSDAASWLDLSGNGNDAIQADATRRPSIEAGALNGRQVRRFDGANDGLRIADSSSVDLNTFSIFAVVRANSRSSFKAIVNKGDYATFNGTNYELTVNTTSGGSFSASIAKVGSFASAVYANTTSPTLVQALRSSNAGVRLFTDGELRSTSSSLTDSLNNVSAALGIGCKGSGTINSTDSWDGDIAEIIIYATALSDSDRILVETYLMTKWGI